MSCRKTKMLSASVFAVLLTAGPVAAWAHEQGAGRGAMHGEALSSASLRALAGAKVSLRQAVAAAEQKTGGHAFEAAVEQDNGSAVYRIATVANSGHVTHLRVDPVSGAVSVTPGLAIVSPEQQQDASLVAGAKLNLIAAIEAAAARIQGPVLGATLNNQNGKPIYQVAIAAPGQIQRLNVDATTGTVNLTRLGLDQGEQEPLGIEDGHEGED